MGPIPNWQLKNFMNRYRVWGSLHVSLPTIQTHPLSSPSRHGIFQIIDARHSFALGHITSSETVSVNCLLLYEPKNSGAFSHSRSRASGTVLYSAHTFPGTSSNCVYLLRSCQALQMR